MGSLLDGIGCQRIRQDGRLDVFAGQDGFCAQGQVRHLDGMDFGCRNPQFLFILVHQIVHHGIFRDSHGGSGQLLRRRKAAVRRRYDEEPAFLGNGTEGHGDDADVGTGLFSAGP